MLVSSLLSFINRPLTRNLFWSVLGTTAASLSQFAMLIALTNLGTATMVGEYGLAMAVVSPVLAFSNLQLQALQSTDARYVVPFGTYLALRLITILISFPVAIGVIVGAGLSKTTQIVAFVLLCRLSVLAVSEIFYGNFMQAERQDMVTGGVIWNSIGGVAGFTFVLALTRSLSLALGASLVVTMTSIPLQHVPALRKLTTTVQGFSMRPLWNHDELWRLFQQAAPLGVISLLVTLQIQIPRLLLARQGNQDNVGILVALASLLVVLTQIYTAVSQVVGPRLARLLAQDDKKGFVRLLSVCVALSSLVLIGLAALSEMLGPMAVEGLMGKEYGAYPRTLFFLSVAAGVRFISGFIAVSATAARRLYSQTLSLATTLLVMIGVGLVLIPSYGVDGAAATIAIGSIVQLGFVVVILCQFLRSWQSGRSTVLPES